MLKLCTKDRAKHWNIERNMRKRRSVWVDVTRLEHGGATLPDSHPTAVHMLKGSDASRSGQSGQSGQRLSGSDPEPPCKRMKAFLKHRLLRTRRRTRRTRAPRPKRTAGTCFLSVCQNALNKWMLCVFKADLDESESEAEQESSASRTQKEDEDSPDLSQTASTLDIGSQPQEYFEVLDEESLKVKHEVLAEIKQKYGVVKSLAKGGNGIVFSANRVEDGFPVIVKVIPRAAVCFVRVRMEKRVVTIPREVYMLDRVGAGPDSAGSRVTPRLLDWYDGGEAIILVIERPVPCVDLFDYVRSDSRDGLDLEERSKVIFRQLLEAALEMEAKGVFHRDIKTCNVLIETRDDDDPRARFIDFGHAMLFTPNQTFHIPQGTTSYSSPEWFRQEAYTAAQATVWQMGCVLFILLFRKQPLISEHSISSWREVPIPNTVSPECKEFLRSCLNKDPEQRMSLENLRNHPWMLSTHAATHIVELA